MNRDKLDKLFDETRQLPQDVSFARIEQLVLLQPVVPVAVAAKTLVWWKTKFFLNTLTIGVITTVTTGSIVYINSGSKDTPKKIVAAATLDQPEPEAEPLPAPAESPIISETPALAEEQPSDEAPETDTAAAKADSISQAATHTALSFNFSFNKTGANSQTCTRVSASASSGPSESVVAETMVDDQTSSSMAVSSGSEDTPADPYRSYHEEPAPACDCQHPTDSIWDCIERSLISEHLVEAHSAYRFFLSPTRFEIDDQEQNDDIANRYRVLYERLSGETLSKHYKIEVYIDHYTHTRQSTIETHN